MLLAVLHMLLSVQRCTVVTTTLVGSKEVDTILLTLATLATVFLLNEHKRVAFGKLGIKQQRFSYYSNRKCRKWNIFSEQW